MRSSGYLQGYEYLADFARPYSRHGTPIGANDVMPASAAPRDLIERAVLERARHASLSRAQDTWSFARAERLFGKEYHGRFLIELLQNAADAWRSANPEDTSCELVVVVDESPALVVANRGAPFPASILLESLGQIGLSSKQAGEAIGHKGIGFKSALEISRYPEIYSGLGQSPPQLAVRFDGERAVAIIREHSPEWDGWVARQEEFRDEPSLAIPVLRYPAWQDDIPGIVTDLANEGFDTVVRLGYTSVMGPQEAWLDTVRAAVTDISDQILVLLRLFKSVRIEDRHAGTIETIGVSVESDEERDGICVDRVAILRNGRTSSNWVRYYRQLSDEGSLSSEITCAIRLDSADRRVPVRAHDDPGASSPFHLFFPTRIGSGLPFLLHGYFEVDAARTGFFSGAVGSNRAVMEPLADLVVAAVDHLTSSQVELDLLAMAELIAGSPRPEAPLARDFYERVLVGLDNVAWLPGAPGSLPCVSPRSLLPVGPGVTSSLLKTFPVDYLRGRTGRELAHPDLSEAVHRFLEQRRGDAEDPWDAFAAILRPGQSSPWPTDIQADRHLLCLLNLIDELKRMDPSRARSLVEGLAGDEEARLIPVTRPDGGRTLVPVPDPRGARSGARAVAVMARLGGSERRALQPPPILDVEFVAHGLLTATNARTGRGIGDPPVHG